MVFVMRTNGSIKKQWQPIHRPLRVLDDAFSRHLNDLERDGWVKTDRVECTPSRVEYRLSHPQFGDLGIVELTQLDDEHSAVIISDPLPPSPRQFTEEEGEALDAIPLGEEYIKQINVTLDKIKGEGAKLYDLRKVHQRNVIQRLYVQLAGDPILRGVFALPATDTEDTESDAGARTGGRPRNLDYDWAYQEITRGRDQSDVYKDWLQRVAKNGWVELADPLDSFKKAMRYRRKKEKRE
jgi:hypothetical protein